MHYSKPQLMIQCKRSNWNYYIIDHPLWKHRSQSSICQSRIQDCSIRRSSLSSSIYSSSNSSSSWITLSHINHQWQKIESFFRIFLHNCWVKHHIFSHLHSNTRICLHSQFPLFKRDFPSLPSHWLASKLKLFSYYHFFIF